MIKLEKGRMDSAGKVEINEGLAIAIATVLAELPAGKTAKMLIALDDAITASKNKEAAAAEPNTPGDSKNLDLPE